MFLMDWEGGSRALGRSPLGECSKRGRTITEAGRAAAYVLVE